MKDRSRIENERDDTSVKHQKLQRKCERLADELHQNKEMVIQLKAKLMEFGDLQVEYSYFCLFETVTNVSDSRGFGIVVRRNYLKVNSLWHWNRRGTITYESLLESLRRSHHLARYCYCFLKLL